MSYDYTDVNTGIDYTDDEMEDIFEGSISGLHDDVKILGYSFSPGKALRELDYIAFREEFNNWLDSEIQEGNYREYVDSPECEDCGADLDQDDVTEALANYDRLVCPSCGEDSDDE